MSNVSFSGKVKEQFEIRIRNLDPNHNTCEDCYILNVPKKDAKIYISKIEKTMEKLGIKLRIDGPKENYGRFHLCGIYVYYA